jgi:hypothetical protein
VSGGSLLPLPRWTEGVKESMSSCTCDRARGRCQLWHRVHDLVIVKWTTTSTTSSERLRRLRASSSTLHRQRLCGNVIPASGLWGLVNRCYHLVEFSWLVLCSCVGNFLFSMLRTHQQGTAEGMEMVMCDWPGFIKEGGHVWLTTGSLMKTKWVSPFPRDFTKNVF